MVILKLHHRQSQRKTDQISSSSAASTPPSSRPRRAGQSTAAHAPTSSASVQRGVGTSDDRRHSLKLTVKAPPSKLREVMRANEVEALQDTLGGGQVLDSPRSSRRSAVAARTSTRAPQRPAYAEFGESDIEDDEDEDAAEDEDEDDEEEVEEEEAMNDFDQLGAEPEGGTDDEDVEMEDAPPPKRHVPPKPPKITLKPPAAKPNGKQTGKPKLVVTPAKVGPLKSVEDQEMEDDPDDDEVDNSSELSDADEDTTANVNDEDDEDAEGEEEEIEMEGGNAMGEEEEVEEEDDADDDDLDDSSDDTPASGSATPDLAKLTKRQRGRPEDQGTLMALDMAPQQRKFFTDAEKAMKKDEHARKRKELTKRKVQEEKTAALNRLLKPQVSKTRGAAPKPETLAAAAAAATGSPYEEEEWVPKANPLYTRWTSSKEGIKLGVPEEWLGKRVGGYFGAPLSSNTSLVQEVE
ncbi:hypothetical protein LTR10_020208 [Elasticomyces elasticus]|uniref:INO80 complex subunit B-like conserved region domain-containing protein n=1 Tax=Exophiala sideris TaxID=1016849 RepID=A0ABR0JS00_9EURO|nr:hypothetical protein LTR10_020208 [Elasticomyces elasticus]KAK5040270.1 hypothetical protein LTS07_000767 [Exophiala sideris]KAK5068648.1 hypothetical protein LTR69_000768 [Exophiala sideris]KAK5186246.1 hypothetical protein LTR44_001301 [Eurotiomycetes sp. CCFEE 6388]